MIGFMVVGRSDVEGEYKIMFYHLYIDDTKQDEYAVAGAAFRVVSHTLSVNVCSLCARLPS